MSVADRGRSRPPVMTDVAQLAGVSHQTVSRVLNDHPNVRPQTRELVLAAISELGYRPNAAARTLVTRRTHTLGVISFDTTLYGPASMLYGIERAAQDTYFVSIASTPTLDRRSVLDSVERFVGQGVEGIIVITAQVSAVEALTDCPTDIPLVAVGCRAAPPVHSVAVDNAEGAALATRYLLGLGHRTVHHLSGPPSWLDAEARVEGWREALREAGAPEPDLVSGDWSAASGYEMRAADRAGRQRDRRPLRQRPDGAGADPRAVGAGAAGAGGRQRGRLRRHPGGGLLPSPADHRAAGFRGAWPAGAGLAGQADLRS